MGKEYEVIGGPLEADVNKGVVISEIKEITERQTITIAQIKERVSGRDRQIAILRQANDADLIFLQEIIIATGLDPDRVPEPEPRPDDAELAASLNDL